MIRRSRRTVPAILVAAVLVAGSVVIGVSCAQSIAGRSAWLPFVSVKHLGAGLTASSPWMIGLGGVVALVGLALLLVAVRPGPALVMPLDGPRHGRDALVSGVSRNSVAHALRAAAMGVDGVDAARVEITEKAVHARVRTPVRAHTSLSSEVEQAIRTRLDTVCLARRPKVRVRVRVRGEA